MAFAFCHVGVFFYFKKKKWVWDSPDVNDGAVMTSGDDTSCQMWYLSNGITCCHGSPPKTSPSEEPCVEMLAAKDTVSLDNRQLPCVWDTAIAEQVMLC